MVIKAIRLLVKASTVIMIAKSGYDAYQAGSTALKAYKKVKGMKDGISGIASVTNVAKSTQNITTEVKRVWKKKS